MVYVLFSIPFRTDTIAPSDAISIAATSGVKPN